MQDESGVTSRKIERLRRQLREDKDVEVENGRLSDLEFHLVFCERTTSPKPMTFEVRLMLM